jgi:hypothetical protein
MAVGQAPSSRVDRVEKVDPYRPEEDAPWLDSVLGSFKERILEALALVALREREACAKVAEAKGSEGIAAAIRARTPTPRAAAEREPAPPSGVEKRTTARFPAGGKAVSLHEENAAATPFPGRLMDYSDGGLGILIDREIAKGTRLVARAMPGDAQAPAAQLEVRYCISTGTGWRIGCRFWQTPRRVAMALLGLSPPQENAASDDDA